MAAVALPSPSSSHRHPENERLLASACWTRDPAVSSLVAAIGALLPIAEALRDLSARRPPIDRLIADEIGSLSPATVETGRINVWRRTLQPTGIIALIWTELDALRGRWISAQLDAEGLDAHAPDAQNWYERLRELEENAPSVSQLWELAD